MELDEANGAREDVEKLPTGIDHFPATRKHDDLTASIFRKYPVSANYPEYIDYPQKKSLRDRIH